MSATNFFTLVIQVFFILLSPLSIFDYLQHRDVTRRDIALMFSSLGATVGIPLVIKLLGVPVPWLSAIGNLCLVAQPYLMLRLVQYFRPSPPAIRRVSLIAMLIVSAAIIIFAAKIPTIVGVVIILYLVAIDGYAMIALTRGALTSTGVVRQRLRLAAAGSGLLALGLLFLILIALFPSLTDVVTVLVLLALMACAVSYYLGFAPPRWLRRAWQLTELRNFLLKSTSTMSPEDVGLTASLKHLSEAAVQAVGAMAAGVIRRDQATGLWQIHSDTGSEQLSSALTCGQHIIEQAWHERQPKYIRISDTRNSADVQQLQVVGADTWLIVPVIANADLEGLLLVLLRHHSLFIDDDLSLLELLAQQSAIVLENYRLIDKLRSYSEELERKVEERTAALRESENRYRDLNTELEQRVLDRTAQLEVANKELEAFSYSVSHDLRAPLRSIDGFSRILMEDFAPELSPDVLRYLNIVRTDTQQMGHLIDDLLAFSRLNRQEVKKLNFYPTDMVNQVLADLRGEQDGRNVQVTVHDMPTVQADPSLLKQVYVNLLSNALKYTRKCEHTVIEVGSQPEPETGKPIYFVRDNGAGFDMRYAHKLFGVFQRLHSAEEYEGTGVGLAIVQRVINRHGGKVWADAEVGKGATFFFTL